MVCIKSEIHANLNLNLKHRAHYTMMCIEQAST